MKGEPGNLGNLQTDVDLAGKYSFGRTNKTVVAGSLANPELRTGTSQ